MILCQTKTDLEVWSLTTPDFENIISARTNNIYTAQNSPDTFDAMESITFSLRKDYIPSEQTMYLKEITGS